MAIHDYKTEYQNHVNKLMSEHPLDKAMSLAVGGSFKTIGGILKALLLQEELNQYSYLIDVGCGSGRLASSLQNCFSGKYLGIDIVPELIKYSQETILHCNFQFMEAPGLSIPESDSVADYVCFFSVFTHLRHEESYLYLKDAKRVLKPGGKIIFSFIDIAEESHWWIFEECACNVDKDVHLNQFISKDMIQVWASRLGLKIESMERATEPFIEIQEPFEGDDGQVFSGNVALGQCVCILEKSI